MTEFLNSQCWTLTHADHDNEVNISTKFLIHCYWKVDIYWRISYSCCAKIVTQVNVVHFLYFYVLSCANCEFESTMLNNFGKFLCHTGTKLAWLRIQTSLKAEAKGLDPYRMQGRQSRFAIYLTGAFLITQKECFNLFILFAKTFLDAVLG